MNFYDLLILIITETFLWYLIIFFILYLWISKKKIRLILNILSTALFVWYVIPYIWEECSDLPDNIQFSICVLLVVFILFFDYLYRLTFDSWDKFKLNFFVSYVKKKK